MSKYRKKPVVIEAFEFTNTCQVSDWPEWAQEARKRQPSEGAIWSETKDREVAWYCGTLEGVHKITFGDFVIQGIKGEIYPCKPDIFEATYEEVPA